MHYRLIFLLLFILAIADERLLRLSHRNSRFKTRRCPVQLDQTIFQCIRKNLLEVPDYMHRNTELLDLSNNQLTILHESNFLKLTRLVKLVLDNNRIWKITESAFKPIGSLLDLSLRNNDILVKYRNSLTSTILKPLHLLQRLDLSNNPLEMIPNELFNSSTTLKTLILDATGKPLEIGNTAFVNIPNLELISLENNQLTTLSQSIFHPETVLKTNLIQLNNNPFNCNCAMKWLRMKLENEDAHRSRKEYGKVSQKFNNPSCYYPLRWRNFPLLQIPIEQLDCDVKITVPQSNITRMLGGHATLACNFYFVHQNTTLFTWLHNNNRVIQSHRIRFQTFGHVNYTSILNITTTMTADSGVYECRVKTSRHYLSKRVYLTVIRFDDDITINGVKIVFTIGIILSIIIIVIVVVFGVMYLLKYRSLLCGTRSKPDQNFNKTIVTETEHLTNDRHPTIDDIPSIECTLSIITSTNNRLNPSRQHFPSKANTLLPKPTFQCSHSLPPIPDYADNHFNVYSAQCPIHGDPSHQTRLNLVCPLHGPKNHQLYFYEMSDTVN